ncbi:hypothetical protein DFP72DRAFT_838747 [Ephemerocybe angulata]|uniref:t-SNARE coiled-coil homology domain-containing protein n=1 Tax=Ephemerocybe angulata TaxID=980116 RepID=A0A8H6MEY1_9AGAR|nr:hypothetical protein DFP72DRAFT_838747 [Tulosesus angulatus]
MSQRIRVRDRSQLLGTTPPPGSGRASPFGGISGTSTPGNQNRYVDDLESQNDEAVNLLSSKVKLLKDITVGIGNEVRDSTAQLSHMNDAFTETGDILSGTFRRMNNMAERHGCKWLWYIVFFIIVFWFFMVVWWFRR